MNREPETRAGGTDFDALFKPKSIAHVGASPKSAAGQV
jgi:acyl-CoA synthetase (NDP forming)